MKPERFQQIAGVFREASARQGAERAAYLDEACGNDTTLRAEVQYLFDVDIEFASTGQASAAMMYAEASESERTVDDAPREMPERIGRYTIKSVLGAGGMGTVYLAVQERPHRRVALKVMKAGVASRSALRRFEFEAQILGRLRHPGIAHVYEAGTHDPGTPGEAVPYFAMEYITGAKPITEYVRAKGLTTRQRLELFERVCDAVHHGHQKGIIHRDLKPSNILVDSSGQPKIIDFGVARATDSDLAVTTLQTDLGQLIGTLQYMSPEQCEGDAHGLDARSDIYGLGVVLYEMLCGCLPYDVEQRSIYEAARVICEQSPNPPSHHNRAIRGDVQAVLLKALSKPRELRYRSAAELGDDLRRALRHEPVFARRPTLLYFLRTYVRRNRRAVVVLIGFLAVAVAAALFGEFTLIVVIAFALIGTVVALYRATKASLEAARERDETRAARMETEVERARAVEAERLVREQQADLEVAQRDVERIRRREELAGLALGHATNESRALQSFVGRMLPPTQHAQGGGSDELTVQEMLRRAASEIDTAFAGYPELECTVRDLFGAALRAVGESGEAEQQLRAAVHLRRLIGGEDSYALLVSLSRLGRTLCELGRHEDAEPLYREVVEMRQRVDGAEHPATAAAQHSHAMVLRRVDRPIDAEVVAAAALDVLVRTGDEVDMLACRTTLAKCAEDRGDHDTAIERFEETIALQRLCLGTEHIEVAKNLNDLANCYQRKNEFELAEPNLRAALDIFRERLGDEHPHTIATLNNLASLHRACGDYDAATDLFEQGLQAIVSEESADVRAVAMMRVNYAECLSTLARIEAAREQLRIARDALKGGEPQMERRIDRKLAALDATGES